MPSLGRRVACDPERQWFTLTIYPPLPSPPNTWMKARAFSGLSVRRNVSAKAVGCVLISSCHRSVHINHTFNYCVTLSFYSSWCVFTLLSFMSNVLSHYSVNRGFYTFISTLKATLSQHIELSVPFMSLFLNIVLSIYILELCLWRFICLPGEIFGLFFMLSHPQYMILGKPKVFTQSASGPHFISWETFCSNQRPAFHVRSFWITFVDHFTRKASPSFADISYTFFFIERKTPSISNPCDS